MCQGETVDTLKRGGNSKVEEGQEPWGGKDHSGTRLSYEEGSRVCKGKNSISGEKEGKKSGA